MTKPTLRQSRLGAARKNLSAAEQNLKKISNTKVRTSAGQSTIGKSRAYELSREDNKRYNDAQKSVSLARKNLKTEQQRAANYAKKTMLSSKRLSVPSKVKVPDKKMPVPSKVMLLDKKPSAPKKAVIPLSKPASLKANNPTIKKRK